MLSWLGRILGVEGKAEATQTVQVSVGAKGEAAAGRLLEKKGYRILERNWRHKKDEIDLICWFEEILVFVEVRARKKGALVSGYDSVNARKKKALLRVCRAYLYAFRPRPRTHRFDIVSIEHEEGEMGVLRHFENVPLFSKPINRGA